MSLTDGETAAAGIDSLMHRLPWELQSDIELQRLKQVGYSRQQYAEDRMTSSFKKVVAEKAFALNPFLVTRPEAGSGLPDHLDSDSWAYPGSVVQIGSDPIQSVTIVNDAPLSREHLPFDWTPYLPALQSIQSEPGAMVYVHTREPQPLLNPDWDHSPHQIHVLHYDISRPSQDFLSSAHGTSLVLGESVTNNDLNSHNTRISYPVSADKHMPVNFDDVIEIQDSYPRYSDDRESGCSLLSNFLPQERAPNQEPLHLSLIYRMSASKSDKYGTYEPTNGLLELLRDTAPTNQPVTLVLDPTSGHSTKHGRGCQFNAAQTRADVEEALTAVLRPTAESAALVKAMMDRFNVVMMGSDQGPEMEKYEEALLRHRDALEFVARSRQPQAMKTDEREDGRTTRMSKRQGAKVRRSKSTGPQGTAERKARRRRKSA